MLIGLYVRLTITETPVFREALETAASRSRCRWRKCSGNTAGALLMGILLSLTAFVLFYLMTVFTLSWGTSALGYTRDKFLLMQLFSILFFAVAIPVSALLAERGRRPMLIGSTSASALFGLVLAPMFAAGTAARWR